MVDMPQIALHTTELRGQADSDRFIRKLVILNSLLHVSLSSGTDDDLVFNQTM